MSIASIILSQMGGNRFVAMVGAYNILSVDNGLMLMFRGCKKANKLLISLRGNDTYTLTFYKVPSINAMLKGKDPVIVYSIDDVMCDNIQEIFTKVTGLYTTLG